LMRSDATGGVLQLQQFSVDMNQDGLPGLGVNAVIPKPPTKYADPMRPPREADFADEAVVTDALDVEQISRIGKRPALTYHDRWHGVRRHGVCQAALRATMLGGGNLRPAKSRVDCPT
jgi:hypothetical protein